MPRDYRNQTGKNAVKEALKKAGAKAKTAKKKKPGGATASQLRERAAAARKATSNKNRARVQEYTTSNMGKGDSYRSARNKALSRAFVERTAGTSARGSSMLSIPTAGSKPMQARMNESTPIKKASKAGGKKPAKAKRGRK